MVTLSGCNRRPTTLANGKHKFAHAPASEMVDLLLRTGCDSRTAASVSLEVLESCTICAESGIPLSFRKISLKHVCEKFDKEA